MWNSMRGRRRKEDDGPGAELEDPQARKQQLARNQQQQTNLQGNIFQDEIETSESEASKENAPTTISKTYANTALVVDPDPRSRARWQRKKVIQMVRKGGKLTREERIKMTEREHLHKSEFLPTSVKKLVMLARQIAGKPIDEAITQMEWSKKKMAAELKYYLEEARDLAVAQRGMGLGRVRGELLDKPRKIRTKDGKWLEITDPTRMYVAQSWVGRGSWLGKELDYKGRGRHGIIKHPSTSKHRHLSPALVSNSLLT